MNERDMVGAAAAAHVVCTTVVIPSAVMLLSTIPLLVERKTSIEQLFFGRGLGLGVKRELLSQILSTSTRTYNNNAEVQPNNSNKNQTPKPDTGQIY